MDFEDPSDLVTSEWDKVWEIFHQAREADATARAQYLKQLQSSDEKLFRTVEALLAAHHHSDGLIEGLVAEELKFLEEERPTQTPELPPGTLLANRFQILRLLGKGGMSTVYEAEDQVLGIPVALKVMRNDLAIHGTARERFHREINLARQITHPGACRIFDLFHHDDLLFLTMELLQGKTLHEKIKEEGPFNTVTALPVVQQVADALGAIHHAGIIHRDFKSSNIILIPQSTADRAVVTDFGLAVTLPGKESLHLTETGLVLGTPEFMAPEQLKRETITSATDIYALGLVMYEMITGEVPHQDESPLTIAAKRISEDAPSPRTLVPTLDRNWERTILRCLERNPKDRFQNASDVPAALKQGYFPGLIPIRSQTKRRFKILAPLLALLAIFLFWQFRSFKSAPPRSDVIVKRIWTGATGYPAGSVSTDGKTVVDIDWQTADVMAIDLDSHAKRRLTHTGTWFHPFNFTPHPMNTVLSADGKQVVYSTRHIWDRGGDLYLVDVENPFPKKLWGSNKLCPRPLDISEDRKKVAVVLQNVAGISNLAVVSTENGAVQILKSLESFEVRKASFSPDARFMIYDYPQQKGSFEHDIFLISLADRKESRIVADKSNDYPLGWTPDGERLAFISNRSGTTDAWLLSVQDGAPELIRKDMGQIFPLRFTPDGSLFYQHLLSSTDVYITSLTRDKFTAPVKMTTGVVGSNGAPEFSPDGQSILFQTVRNPVAVRWETGPQPMFLKILSLQTQAERDVLNHLHSLRGAAKVSPDRKSILITGDDGNISGLFKVDLETGATKSVRQDLINDWVRRYQWNTDGTGVFYLMNKGGKIFLQNVETGENQKIFSAASDFVTSADGQWLAVMYFDQVNGATSLKLVHSNGENVRQLFHLSQPEWISALAWSPDGNAIYFTRGRRDLIDEKHQLWKYSMKTNQLVNLGIQTPYVRDMAVHPDGSQIAFWTIVDTSELWVMENFLPPLKPS